MSFTPLLKLTMSIRYPSIHQQNQPLSDHYYRYGKFLIILIILGLVGPAAETIAQKIV